MGMSATQHGDLMPIDKALLCFLRDRYNQPTRLTDIQKKIEDLLGYTGNQTYYHLNKLKAGGLLSRDNAKLYTLSSVGCGVAESLPHNFVGDQVTAIQEVYERPHRLRAEVDTQYEALELVPIAGISPHWEYPKVPKLIPQIETLLATTHTVRGRPERRVFACPLSTIIKLRMWTHPLQGYAEWVMAEWVKSIERSCHFYQTRNIPYAKIEKAASAMRRLKARMRRKDLMACYSGKSQDRINPRTVESLLSKVWHMAPFKSTHDPQSLFSSFLEETMPGLRMCIATDNIDGYAHPLDIKNPIPAASFGVIHGRSKTNGVGKYPVVVLDMARWHYLLKDWVTTGEFDYLASVGQKKVRNKIMTGLSFGMNTACGRDRAEAFTKVSPMYNASLGPFEVGFPALKEGWIQTP